MRSSSPVTELTSGLPPAVFSPSRSAPTTDESTLSGMSTTDCTASIAATITFGSSSCALATPSPAFTSSTPAPACTWANASALTRLKSPASISAANALRPVGLMRSPITTKGKSDPMTVSLPFLERRTVFMTISPGIGNDFRCQNTIIDQEGEATQVHLLKRSVWRNSLTYRTIAFYDCCQQPCQPYRR